jgi:hypothetical protein
VAGIEVSKKGEIISLMHHSKIKATPFTFSKELGNARKANI